jgi:hypothetical protein
MSSMHRMIATIAGSAALLTAPVGVCAATPAPPTVAQPGNAWLTLSMLTPSGAAALGATGVSAAQPEAAPPPPPESGGMGTPPLPVIAVWVAVVAAMIYIATRNHHHHRIPNSPA